MQHLSLLVTFAAVAAVAFLIIAWQLVLALRAEVAAAHAIAEQAADVIHVQQQTIHVQQVRLAAYVGAVQQERRERLRSLLDPQAACRN